jgi:hypothetical protein
MVIILLFKQQRKTVMESNLHSVQKLRAEIQASKLFRFLMTKEQKKEAQRNRK